MGTSCYCFTRGWMPSSELEETGSCSKQSRHELEHWMSTPSRVMAYMELGGRFQDIIDGIVSPDQGHREACDTRGKQQTKWRPMWKVRLHEHSSVGVWQPRSTTSHHLRTDPRTLPSSHRITHNPQIRQPPHIPLLPPHLRPRKRRRQHRSITPRQIPRALRHTRIPIILLGQIPISRRIVLDGPQESVAPPVQAADRLVVFPGAVGVCLADLEAGGGGEVVEEGFRDVGEGDAARVGVFGGDAVEELS